MNEANQLRELHGFRLFGYTIGQFGFFLTRVLISIFSFQFYVYTINLDSIYASIGLSVNFVLNATSMIIFGVLADKIKFQVETVANQKEIGNCKIHYNINEIYIFRIL